jgi:chromosome segregation ATPase
VCKERETIKRDKDIANNEIRKIGADLVEVKTSHKQIEDQNRKQREELKRQLEILNEDVIESDKQRESDKNESHSTYYRIKYENQKLNGFIREHEQTIKEFKEIIARKINQLEQQEATIIILKQEIEDNKFLLEQTGIQEKAKESQKNELNTMIVQLQRNVDVSEKQLNHHLSTIIKLKQEIEDNKLLLEQKAVQVKAKESHKMNYIP